MSDWFVCLKPVAGQLPDLVLSSFCASVSSSVKQTQDKKSWGFGEAMQVKYELNAGKQPVVIKSFLLRPWCCLSLIGVLIAWHPLNRLPSRQLTLHFLWYKEAILFRLAIPQQYSLKFLFQACLISSVCLPVFFTWPVFPVLKNGRRKPYFVLPVDHEELCVRFCCSPQSARSFSSLAWVYPGLLGSNAKIVTRLSQLLNSSFQFPS